MGARRRAERWARRARVLHGLALLPLAWACDRAPRIDPGEWEAPPKVAASSKGMVVAAQPLAAQAGARILGMGGNAADAAVAAAFAISVVEPSMNSIGGRTQVLVRRPDGTFAGIDATTQAPWSYDPSTAPQATYGYPTVGVPGALRGLERLLNEHGTLDLAQVMAPAISLAENGFELLEGEARRHRAGSGQLAEFEGSRNHFFNARERTHEPGELFQQPELAQTLRAIATGGADAFYRGPIAQRMAADIQAHGGAVDTASLAAYRAVDATVVRGSYRGRELVATGLPASGAVTIGILHILENFDMAQLERDSWAALVGTAIARTFEERVRARTMSPVNFQFMTDKAWARGIAADMDVPGVALRAAALRDHGAGATTASPVWRAPARSPAAVQDLEVPAGRPIPPSTTLSATSMARFLPPSVDWDGSTWGPASGHTTHLSTTDGRGMYVSLTQTIGPNLGSKVVTPGLGFLYAATLGGYLGEMAPGSRAASSISPLMVIQDGQPVLVLGAAGGARIISAVVQSVLRVIDQGMGLPEALAAARVHPIEGGIAMETSPGIGWTGDEVARVRSWGLEVQEVEADGAFGRIHGIWVDPRTGEAVGVADPDWEGAAIGPEG